MCTEFDNYVLLLKEVQPETYNQQNKLNMWKSLFDIYANTSAMLGLMKYTTQYRTRPTQMSREWIVSHSICVKHNLQ